MPTPILAPLPSPQAGLSLRLLDIRQQQPQIDSLLEHLSGDERAQSLRYRQTHDQLRFVYGRWALRFWLGQILGQAPGDVLLSPGPYGKPMLPDKGLPHFNLSHAGDYVLLGLHDTCTVGVDIEQTKMPAPLEVMRGIFSLEEQRYCQHGQDGDKFYALWTAKEAILKAWGTGFTEQAPTIAVIDENLHWRQRITADTEVWPIAVPTGYAGAVALSSGGRK